MAWTTILGHKVYHPHEFGQQFCGPLVRWNESDKALIDGYRRLHEAAVHLDNALLNASRELVNLRAENAFMLRLINAHMEEIKDANKT